MTFRKFESWQAVLDHVRAGLPIWYLAPLDVEPNRIGATCKPKGYTVRVRPFDKRRRNPFDPFTADSGHLDRFCRPVSA